MELDNVWALQCPQYVPAANITPVCRSAMSITLLYLDDIIVFSSSVEQHLLSRTVGGCFGLTNLGHSNLYHLFRIVEASVSIHSVPNSVAAISRPWN